ncbi:MAG: hypothetical protein KAU29_11040, partial [Gammaproteobacteria bacterium]|nr:hypothetical protein [Gammaproteobacteria bacterium]
MKMLNRKPPGLHKKAIGIAAGIFLSAFLMPGSAFATTAANAVITNTATVNYDDSGGNAQTAIVATVDVTVNLVTAHPTLSAPIDASVASGVTLDYTYTITNNSNGPDAYALTAADNLPQAGITSQTHVFRDAGDTGDIVSITLGATSLAAAAVATDTTITVPNDGTADASQNGIVVGDTINIGGEIVVVTAVTDTGAGTDTITFGPALVGGHALGAQVGEQATFISRTTPIATINNSTYIITVTADDGVTAGAAPTDDTTTTVLVINLTVTKYVANTTAVVVGGGSTITVNTGLGAGNITYYTTGVTGNPGDVLEYVIGIANALASATATDVVISDPVPNFTAQTGNIALDPGTGTWSDVATTA